MSEALAEPDWTFSKVRTTQAEIEALNSLLNLPLVEGFSLDLGEQEDER